MKKKGSMSKPSPGRKKSSPVTPKRIPKHKQLPALRKEITERHQVGQTEEQRQLLETILEQAADAIIVCDNQGRLTFVNAAARSMALRDPEGATLEELPLILGEAYDSEERLVLARERPLSRALRGDRTLTRRYRLVRHAGSYSDVLISAVPLRGPEGEIIGAVATLSDVTTRIQAEEEIKRLNEDLRQRTLELESANRELEAFAYSVSHDLKTPLVALEAFGRKVLDRLAEKLDAKTMEYLNQMGKATERMGNLIEDLLRLSQVTRKEMRLGRVDLTGMAKSIAEELQKTVPTRTVEFRIAEDMVAKGDSRLLRVALDNLIGNAWKFTGRCPRAVIEFGFTSPSHGTIYFVRDNGWGFDMAHADKLFKPLQRLHAYSEFPGTGIGLATVHRVITRHGGRIWAESAVGKGATFLFSLEPESVKR